MNPLLTFLVLSFPGSLLATNVYVLSVGANHSFDSQLKPLNFAESDAERFAEAMTSVGLVPKARSQLLLNPSLGDLQQTTKNLIQNLTPNEHNKFIFYFSGHSDDRGIHLFDGVYSKKEMHDFFADIEAETRIALLDSCFSGSLGRKGIAPADSFDVPKLQFDEPSGSIFMTASSANQLAFESKELESSIFTHHLLAGLYGDADGNEDGLVTVDELYQYVYSHTKWQSINYPTPKLQEPEFVSKLEGHGAIVLSFPKQMDGTFTLSEDLSGQVSLASTKGLNFFKIAKVAGHDKKVRLPSGHYRISIKENERVGVGTFELKPTKRILIASRDLTWNQAAPIISLQKGRKTTKNSYRYHVNLGNHQGYSNEMKPGFYGGFTVSIPSELTWFRWLAQAGFHHHTYSSHNAYGLRADIFSLYGGGLAEYKASSSWIPSLGWAALLGQNQLTQRGEAVGGGFKQATVTGVASLIGMHWSVRRFRLGLSIRNERLLSFSIDRPSDWGRSVTFDFSI